MDVIKSFENQEYKIYVPPNTRYTDFYLSFGTSPWDISTEIVVSLKDSIVIENYWNNYKIN